MNSNKIIRITGMVITVISFLLATPLLLSSLLLLILFQGVGGPWWVAALHIITVTAIIASFPIIFTGFIMKYKLKVFIYLIIALLLTALDLAIINVTTQNSDYLAIYYATSYYGDSLGPALFSTNLVTPYFYYTIIVLAAIIFSIPALIYLIGWYLNRSNAEKPKMRTDLNFKPKTSNQQFSKPDYSGNPNFEKPAPT